MFPLLVRRGGGVEMMSNKWKSGKPPATRCNNVQSAQSPRAFIRPLHIHPSIHLYWASLECPTEWRRNRQWQKDDLDTSNSILLSNKSIISLFLWSYGYQLVYTHYTLYLLSKNTHKTSLQTLSTSFAKRSLPLRTIPRVVLLPGVNSSGTITSFSLLFRDRLSICILVLVLVLMLVPAGTSSPRRSKSSFTSLLCSLLLLLLPGVCPCECEVFVE